MNLEALNEQFGIVDAVAFEPIEGGLVAARIQSSRGSARVALHGAHILDFCPVGGRPVLWLSKESWFEPGKAIRGGIPICWPWFGKHPRDESLPFHGFARISQWEVVHTFARNDSTTIHLRLPETAAAEMWPDAFRLELRVTVSSSLALELEMCNQSDAGVTFTAALHSYFAVSDIGKISVDGLDGTHYLDTTQEPNRPDRQTGAVTVTEEVDRVYVDTDATCIINDPGWHRRITIAKSGSRSTVVWNPWAAKSARMADFGNDEYHDMICVETVNARNDARTLAPGESHTLAAVIGVSGGV